MLIVSRKAAQTIEIAGGITVQIMSVRGKEVRIGVEAPKEIKVLRGEVAEKDRQREAGA